MVGVGCGGLNVAEQARVVDELHLGSKSLRLERMEGMEAMLIICLSPSNKCPGVHKRKHLQLLKWSNSIAQRDAGSARRRS